MLQSCNLEIDIKNKHSLLGVASKFICDKKGLGQFPTSEKLYVGDHVHSLPQWKHQNIKTRKVDFMGKNEVWTEMIQDLVEANFNEYKQSREYQLRHRHQEQVDEMLTTNLTKDEKIMVDEVMFELGAATERDGTRLYQQGMKDCVMILKTMGVIA